MKRKILSIIICLAMVASFFTGFTTSVSAAASPTLDVYVQRGSGAAVLLHTYSPAEIMAIAPITQYYTAIDNLPTYTQSKASGVTLTDLANDAKKYDIYKNVAFRSGDSIYMQATDNWNRIFYYDNNGTTSTSKFYGLGLTRYYYPNAYRYIDDQSNVVYNHDRSGAVPVQPFLAVYSVWSRSKTVVNDFHDGKSFEDVPLGTVVTSSVLDTEFQHADTSNSFRIGFGLTEAEDINETATAPAHGYWVCQVKFIMPAYNVTVGSFTGGTVTPNAASTGNAAGDIITLTVAPENGKQLGTLTATYNSGQTLGLTQGAGNTYTFTMPAYPVTVNATFGVASGTHFWDLNNDRTCNIGDIVAIGNCWKNTGAAGWIPADVNKDGVINVGDVVMVGLHWGETWQP